MKTKQENNKDAPTECPFCNGSMDLKKVNEYQVYALEENGVAVCAKHQQEILDMIIRGEL